jgi:hypothetical protein
MTNEHPYDEIILPLTRDEAIWLRDALRGVGHPTGLKLSRQLANTSIGPKREQLEHVEEFSVHASHAYGCPEPLTAMWCVSGDLMSPTGRSVYSTRADSLRLLFERTLTRLGVEDGAEEMLELVEKVTEDIVDLEPKALRARMLEPGVWRVEAEGCANLPASYVPPTLRATDAVHALLYGVEELAAMAAGKGVAFPCL